MWTMEQAKRDFRFGFLDSFHIERVNDGVNDVWRVRLRGGSASGVLVDAREKKPRLFKSLDSAVSAVEQIGFKVDSLH